MSYEPIYYAADADTWCEDCTIKRYGSTEGRDHEGNDIGAAFPDSSSDTPCHCAGCGVFLENPLTSEGESYVLQAIIEDLAAGRASAAVTEWAPFYELPDSLELDPYADRFEIVEGAYWACADFHAGQASRGYRHLSKLGRHYRPGAAHRGWASLNSNARAAYVRVAVSLIRNP